jgi:Kef-type K+ transport system membrane component KefB
MQGRARLTRVDFGGGGDVFFVILFVMAGATLHLEEVVRYAPVALAFVLARVLAKVGTVYGCGRAFGQTHREAASEGLMLIPMAGLAIGLVQTVSLLMPQIGGRVSAIVLASVALFETIGPPITAFALRYVGEAGRNLPEAQRSAGVVATDDPPTDWKTTL